FFFFQAEDGIRDFHVTGVQTCALPIYYPRSHPSPLETCGCIADIDPATGHATIYMTSQAPHAHRTLFAMVAGLPEQNIRIVSPEIGRASCRERVESRVVGVS